MHQDTFILLLSKQFSGDISAEENTLLQNWLSESPDNARLARQLRQIWEKSDHFGKNAVSVDLDHDFARLQSRIQTLEQPRGKVISIGQRWMRLAAALAFLLVALWGYRQFTTTASTVTETVVSEDKRLIQLSDGTRVWLRHNASLAYPRSFAGNERRVKLKGEAYFEVTHNPAKPFRVETPENGVVEVLGTEFCVRAEPGENESFVLVKSGKVRFSPDGYHAGATLTAKRKAVFNRKTSQIVVTEVSTLNDLAWQTGGLVFVRTPLAQVVTDLEKYYGVKIDLRNDAMRDCLHIAPLTNQPIETVIKSLATSYHFQVSNPENGHYVLDGGNCNGQ